MARPISRDVLSFGLVSIPVELDSAIEDHNIRFHLLHKKCGSRVQNQIFCPVCTVVIDRSETVRGYEVSKGHYVRIETRSSNRSKPKRTAASIFANSSRLRKLTRSISRAAIISRPTKERINHIGCSPTRC
jgi:non-homologous end joining protein Ku